MFVIAAALVMFFTPLSITYYRTIDKNNETPLPNLPRKNFRPPEPTDEEEVLSLDLNVPSSADIAASVDPTGVLKARNKLAGVKGKIAGKGGKSLGKLKIEIKERLEEMKVSFKEFLKYAKTTNKKQIVIGFIKGIIVGTIVTAVFIAAFAATYPFIGQIRASYNLVSNPTEASTLDGATAACANVRDISQANF
jgi:hypothetical protein